MKRILVLLLVYANAYSMQGQFSTAFQKQFGSGSHIYNTPLYFSCVHMKSRTSCKSPKKSSNYRAKIQREQRKKNKKKNINYETLQFLEK